jgi:hypothetical protein
VWERGREGERGEGEISCSLITCVTLTLYRSPAKREHQVSNKNEHTSSFYIQLVLLETTSVKRDALVPDYYPIQAIQITLTEGSCFHEYPDPGTGESPGTPTSCTLIQVRGCLLAPPPHVP